MEIACESRIVHVAVYARGAVVTRAVTVPRLLPPGLVDLVIPGVTALSSAGSARARAEASPTASQRRDVLTLRMRLVVPAAPPADGSLLERLHELGHERERLDTERSQLLAQRQALASFAPEAALQNRWRPVDAGARVLDAVAACAIASDLAAAIDAKILDISGLLEKNARDYHAADLAVSQRGGASSGRSGLPTREIVARIGAGDADGLSSLEVSYIVGAARWWPAYAVRLSDGGRRAAWAKEALVAQASGEDWTGALLSFCSAGLVRDLRLPELRSLRLGRAQPAPPRRGYRPPPAGLDELFASYDGAAAAAAPPLPPPAPPPPAEKVAYGMQGESFDEGGGGGAFQPQSFGAADEETRAAVATGSPAPKRMAMPMPAQAPGAMPTSAAMPAPAPMAASVPMMSPAAGLRARGGPNVSLALGGAHVSRDADTSPGFDVARPPEIEPADAWLEFDALAMGGSSDRAKRGRLVLDDGAAGPAPRGPHGGRAGAGELGAAQARASVAIERLAPPLATDPHDATGGQAGAQESFDVRYDGKVTADVPANARIHRVPIDAADGPALPRLVTVPREATDVYRETLAENPFGVALLPGPADIFVDGALLTTTPLAATARGGKVVLGLGVEPRVRIARNARATEGTGGLLGGTATVDHVVSIDVVSSLGHAAALELYERVPVTDDKDVAVELKTAQPAPARYDQSDRGKPVRGGLRWNLELAPGAKQTVEYGYRVTLPAKSEIVGGNRRE